MRLSQDNVQPRYGFGARGLAAILFVLSTPLSVFAQQHPNFTGSWTRTSRSCQPVEKTGAAYRMTIDHHDPALEVEVASGTGSEIRRLSLSYNTTGEALQYTGLDGDQFESKPHWRGDIVRFDIVEQERGTEIHAEETWELIDNGTTLRLTKKEDGGGEHSTCTSLFAKDSPSPVKITLQKDRIVVEIDGKPFTNLYMGAAAHKPFLYPLLTASGKRVTRGFPVDPLPGDPTDHPHQKGLWVGAEHVSGMDFWENDPSYKRPNMGRIVFKDVLNTRTEPDRGSFTMLSDWVSLEGKPVLTETRTMTFYANPPDCRIFDVDLTLRARRDVTFEDHHDAVIGMRLGPAFDEQNGGLPVNAEGLAGEGQTRGKRSGWVDWQTNLQGERIGVALLSHPSNFGSPTRWHIRSMGLLVASPFAQRDYVPTAPDGSKTLHASEELHLRYRVVIHPQSASIAALYKEFSAE